MAKVECFTPDGKMEMKEPVDARECVENCGYTMELREGKAITEIVESEGTCEIMEEIESSEELIAAPTENKRGRKRKNK
jgi:hypothetical protein